jgi:hypothetical protein
MDAVKDDFEVVPTSPAGGERQAERAALKAERKAAKQRAEAERRLRREQEAEARQTAERLEREATAARAYEHYLRVRDWARSFAAAGVRSDVPLAPAEREMAAALAPLWDASPEMIAGLRRWSEPITGVRPADYDNPSKAMALPLKYAVGNLRHHAGADLFVEESPLLGGFGVEWHRQRYNEDTVRFFKAVVALQDGGVLGECRGHHRRRFVWEIGGGWGGFAFQFKTVCPNVTYMITGIPELLLVSAVYLMTAFPEARIRLYDPSGDADLWNDWPHVDFVFVPDAAVASLRTPAIDATFDVMALRYMNEERITLHVERAFDLGSRYFFSQRPGPCFPRDLPYAWRAIARRYWLHQVPPPLDVAAFAVKRFEDAPVIDDYAQAVGWRRLVTE